MFVAALFTRAKWNQLKRLWTDEWMEKIWWCGLLLLSHVRLLVTPRTEACQASLSFTISWSLLKLMSMEEVMPCKHLILCRHTIFHSGSITLHSHKDYFASMFISGIGVHQGYSPPALNLSQHQDLFQWISSSHQVAKICILLRFINWGPIAQSSYI